MAPTAASSQMDTAGAITAAAFVVNTLGAMPNGTWLP